LLAQYFSLFVQEIMKMERIKTDEIAIKQMKDAANLANICMLITTGADSKRTNRPMAATRIDDEGNCWFFASKSSGKIKDISINNKIQLVFANPDTDEYLEIHGSGITICDQDEIQKNWSPLVNEWFPRGITDPEICLVKIEVSCVFYWDVALQEIRRLVIKTTTIEEEQRLAA
jgi:general stress protein 26